MAVDMFIVIGDIKGESADAGYPNAIERHELEIGE